MDKFNLAAFDEWIAALESGEYAKGVGQLRSESGEYCCLGVFCEAILGMNLAVDPTWRGEVTGISGQYDGPLAGLSLIPHATRCRLAMINDRSSSFKPVVAELKAMRASWIDEEASW